MIIIRRILTVSIIGLIIIGFFVFEPFCSEPPSPTVTVGKTKISTTQGSYCWNGPISAKCVDMVYTSPLDMAKKHTPTSVSPGEEIKIDFRKDPIDESLIVEQWIDEENVNAIQMKDNSIVAPKEKGVYVYYITADWKQGDGNYAFSVVVE
ncbi:hypothetical protein [Psychrobacillus sp. FSL K6-2843]|uniref:hypothetical protein n=1 Tax=Psychrobacillus sp. FSL K6-2843 TaxID=2921549 RepID=UPI00315B3730